MGKLLLLFTAVPLLELFLLMRLSSVMGFGTTLSLVLVTGVVGALLAKTEGLRVFRSWQEALAVGRVPADGVVSGLLVLIGGVLLVTPGVMTDALGFLLLLPFTRRPVALLVARRLQRSIDRGTIHVMHDAGFGAHPGYSDRRGVSASSGYGRPAAPSRPSPGTVIDVEAEVVDSQGPGDPTR